MKKAFSNITAALCILASMWGCKPDLSGVESRLDELEKDMQAVQEQIAALNSGIAALDYLKSSCIISQATNSDGMWVLRLSDNKVIKIWASGHGSNIIPVLMADAEGYLLADYGDGRGYVYVLDDKGNKIPFAGKDGQDGQNGQNGQDGQNGQNGTTPVLGVDKDGYWTVNGVQMKDAEGKPIPATVEEGDSYFSDVVREGNFLILTLSNGETVKIPVVEGFVFSIDAEALESFTIGQTREYPVEAKNVASVTISAPDGWKAVLENNLLKVTAPAKMTKSMVVYDPQSSVSVLAVSMRGFAAMTGFQVELGDGVDKSSNYEMWKAGYDIVIDGVVYNKEKCGEGTLLGNGETINGPGVYFIKKGQTVQTAHANKYDYAARQGHDNYTIIMSEHVSQKASLVLHDQFAHGSAGGYQTSFLFNNLNISYLYSESMFSPYYSSDESITGSIVFKNCSIDRRGPNNANSLVYYDGRSYRFRTLKFLDCDYILNTLSSAYLFGTGGVTVIDDFKMDNCLIYCPGSENAIVDFSVIMSATIPQGAKITLTNNTFVNVLKTPGNGGMIGGNFQGAFAPVLSNNLIYLTKDHANVGKTTGLLHSGWGDMTSLTSADNVGANYYYSEQGNANNIIFNAVYSNGRTAMTRLTESPFSTINIAEGVFENKTSYGATR